MTKFADSSSVFADSKIAASKCIIQSAHNRVFARLTWDMDMGDRAGLHGRHCDRLRDYSAKKANIAV
jgi:hypothetical protein